ncbi:hypothetical protein QTP88_019915 [Uroleucon formosanum]
MAFDGDKKFVAEFIDEYKNHPALWNVKIKALVLKCKEKIPEADEAFVKKKINNLRTAFRRELAKVRSSKRTGSSTDDIYILTLIRLKLILWLKILRLKIRSFSSPSSVIPSPNLIKKSSKSLISKKREFMDIASETIKSLNAPMKEDDEYDIIGKRLAQLALIGFAAQILVSYVCSVMCDVCICW